jgi:ADP-Ribosyltransferase in polyvalent proteins
MMVIYGDPQRAKNLARWHEDSHPETKNPDGTPRVFYHGTTNDFSKFRMGRHGQPVKAIFASSTPELADFFAMPQFEEEGDVPNVMPIHVKAKNPFNYENPHHVHKILMGLRGQKDFMDDYGKTDWEKYENGIKNGDWRYIEDPWVQEQIRGNKHDGFFANGRKTKFLAVYDPTQVKSATGNNGNFDPHDPDITKADGGSISKDTAIHKGRKFWSGVFDAHDGFIREVHPYKKAEAADFHHSYYVSPQSQDAMKHGDAGFFWVDPNGSVNTHWRDGPAPQHIEDAIKSQIEPIHKQDGGGITAYHGSPHDFEQFDTSKIGTGEGNQSYGHGLYFAEQEPVAKGYRDQLAKSRGKFKIIDEKTGEEVNPNVPGYEAAHYFYSSDFYDQIVDDMRSQKNEHIAYLDDTDPSELAEKQLLQTTKAVPHGHMYEVTIDAHPDHFLDWDKPISEQQKIMELLKPTGFTPRSQSTTGNDLYHMIDNHFDDPKKASEFLHSAGIHGIRYLDAGSRNIVNNYGGAGTRNYVVFDHNRVKINRKYEQGGFVNGYNDGGTIHEPHKRAEEQGYSIKGYHFTRGPKAQSIAKSKQFDPYLSEGGEHATFFWDNPQAANDWAHFAGGVDPNKPQEKMTPYELDRLSRFAPSMLPVRIHPGKHTVVNWPEATGSHRYDNNAMKKLIQNARNEGYDTVRIKNMVEGDMDSELGRNLSQPYDQIAVLNPNVIRSEFAQFDPARQHENDIGARKGGTVNREKIDYKNTLHSPIVKHVLDKISAPLPALDPHLLAAIAGRRS